MNQEQLERLRVGKGFIAALDQSGESTPDALELYGIAEVGFPTDDAMFDLIHEMRTRIITSRSFTGDRIIGTILFERTMDSEIGGLPSAEYLWSVKGVVPFLKVDRGLADMADGSRRMNPIPDLGSLLERAKEQGVFGTKMRSLIRLADPGGVNAVVDQQVEIGCRILDAGLIPILEPEVDIDSPQKAEVELLLKHALLSRLDELSSNQSVILKLTLPEEADLYRSLVEHPRVVRMAALSGGYSREEANARLASNSGVVASFSRAFTEGLRFDQSDSEFDAALEASVESLYEASIT
jgi:fructose-bisphosphate aldolase class I